MTASRLAHYIGTFCRPVDLRRPLPWAFPRVGPHSRLRALPPSTLDLSTLDLSMLDLSTLDLLYVALSPSYSFPCCLGRSSLDPPLSTSTRSNSRFKPASVCCSSSVPLFDAVHQRKKRTFIFIIEVPCYVSAVECDLKNSQKYENLHLFSYFQRIDKSRRIS